MNYFLGFLFILILLLLIHNFSKKRKLKKYREYLHTNWGKEKKKEYYNFFIIGKYFANNSHKDKAYHIISEKCKIDLDVNATICNACKYVLPKVCECGNQCPPES